MAGPVNMHEIFYPTGNLVVLMLLTPLVLGSTINQKMVVFILMMRGLCKSSTQTVVSIQMGTMC